MIRNLILSAALLLLSSIAFAQRGHTVTARLLDSSSGEPVAYATVSLTAKGATKPAKYVLSDDSGKVLIDGVKSGSYTLKAELLGYEAHSAELELTKNIELGDIKMKPDTKMLDAASISATGNPIIIKKDTIEYNATSFKTTDNDVLED